MSAVENIKVWLEIKRGQIGNGADPEVLSTVTTTSYEHDARGEEVEGVLRASDIEQALWERREAIELLDAYVRYFPRSGGLPASARSFLAKIESDA